mgnify:CR=1 FL=1
MPTYASIMAQSPPRQTYNPIPMDSPKPMESNVIHQRGSLSDEGKQRCQENRLYMYCGDLGHIAVIIPID